MLPLEIKIGDERSKARYSTHCTSTISDLWIFRKLDPVKIFPYSVVQYCHGAPQVHRE